MLNLEWLRTFKAIYETGTLSSAAQALFISQPGVSLHLSSLESYTGYKLFEREARKMMPTERGKMLYNYVLDPLLKLENAEELFHRSSKTDRPTISVGMCFETFQFTLEEHIAQLPFNLIIKFGDYPQMIRDLDNGLLDLIVTPHKGQQDNLEYRPFAKERIVLIGGGQSDIDHIQQLVQAGDKREIEKWLKQQIWYSTAADMEHLKHFWLQNFGTHPDFKPNYIVPNISSIIRCLSNGEGFAVVPDFLCLKEVEAADIKLVWEGSPYLENVLHFGSRKKTIYAAEIQQLEKIFLEKMAPIAAV